MSREHWGWWEREGTWQKLQLCCMSLENWGKQLSGKASTGILCSVLDSQYEMDDNKLERDQQRTAKMVRSLKAKSEG